MRVAISAFIVAVLEVSAAGLAGPQVPVTVSPGSADVVVLLADRCPTFSWATVPLASSVHLAVYRVDEAAAEQVVTVLSVELPGAASSWTPALSHRFDTGVIYAWRVGAVVGDGEPVWSAPAWFEVTDVPTTEPGRAPRVHLGAVEARAGETAGASTGSATTPAADAGVLVEVVPATAAKALASYFSVSSTGNVTGNVFTGDGSGLSNLPSGKVVGLTTGGVLFGSLAGAITQDAASFFWDDGNNRLGLGTGVPNEQLELTGNLRLASGTGQIKLGATRFLHNAGSMNVWLGEGAGRVSTTGYQNTAVGYLALSTEAGTLGYHNSAVGSYALASNSSGAANTAMGFWALKANTTADNNAAFGESALQSNTIGAGNTALGSYSLMNNTTASRNTAVGMSALYTQSYNTGASTYEADNTAVGAEALYHNEPANPPGAYGTTNTAVGAESLYRNTSGRSNTAVGWSALWNNQTGISNVAVGVNALNSTGTGVSYNTAVGVNAGYNATGDSGVFLGFGAGYSESSSNRLHVANAIDKSLIYGEFDNGRVLINRTTSGETPTATLDVNGYLRVRQLSGTQGNPLCYDGNNVLSTCGSLSSDARLKRDVRDLTTDVDVLAALERLRGVTFNWDKALKRNKSLDDRRQIGMIAQEVEPVLPELVTTDAEGFRSLDYPKLTAFLIEVAKAQQGRIEALEAALAENASRDAEIAELTRRLAELEQALRHDTAGR